MTSRSDIPKRGKTSPSPSPLPPAPRPARRSRCKINYLQLNDGLEDPVIASLKPRKQKPYSPPPRDGPSSTRQAANKHARSSLDLEDLMEDTVVKLPDLVRSTNDPECGEDTVLNAVTQTEEMPLNTDTVQTPTLDTPILTSDDEFNGVPDSTTVNPANEQVTPLNTGDKSENGTMDPANEHVTPLNTDDKSENGNTVNNKTDSVDTSTDQHPES